MHPLVQDLSKLTDKELTDKFQKVIRIMRTVGTVNGSVYQQANMIFQTIQEEQRVRFQKALDEQIKNSGGANFDDIINIG